MHKDASQVCSDQPNNVTVTVTHDQSCGGTAVVYFLFRYLHFDRSIYTLNVSPSDNSYLFILRTCIYALVADGQWRAEKTPPGRLRTCQ